MDSVPGEDPLPALQPAAFPCVLAWGGRGLWSPQLTRALIPSWGRTLITSSSPDRLPGATPPKPSHGGRASTHGFGRDTDVLSLMGVSNRNQSYHSGFWKLCEVGGGWDTDEICRVITAQYHTRLNVATAKST